jgi:hypothetical protein
MNMCASNKLLKLLEEPQTKRFYIDLKWTTFYIIQTIRSRCQVPVHFECFASVIYKMHWFLEIQLMKNYL